MLGLRYSWGAAISLGWSAKMSSMWNPIWAPRSRERIVICSQVFHDAYTDTVGNSLQGCNIADLVMPAHLSATTDLDDVSVPWLRLV